MNTVSFLNTLQQEGIELRAEGNNLKCSAPKGAMTEKFAQEITLRKQEILDILKSSNIEKWSSLVAIKPQGKLPPFFCFHGVGGNVLNYAVFSKYLDEEQPLYGVQSQGLDGLQPPLSSLEKMASHYLAEIQTIQPKGPYYLGGGSMGGNIAFEAAQQLKARGEEIGLLILFDALGSNIQMKNGNKQNKFSDTYNQLRDLTVINKLSFLANKIKGKISFHIRMKQCKAYLRKREPIPHDLRFWFIEHQNYQAMSDYKFKPYMDEIILLRSNMEAEGWYSDPNRGWKGIATKLTIKHISGQHENLIENPDLGRYVNKALKNAQQNHIYSL